MKIIKDKQITEDHWTHLAEDNKIIDGDITIPMARWKKEKESLKNHNGRLGIRLSPTDSISELDDLNKIGMIALEFPAFTDGRSFSQARLLRSEYNFKGEIRAMGNYMPDQVYYLSRVGVNAFELDKEEQLELALSTMNDFTVNYQTSTN